MAAAGHSKRGGRSVDFCYTCGMPTPKGCVYCCKGCERVRLENLKREYLKPTDLELCTKYYRECAVRLRRG